MAWSDAAREAAARVRRARSQHKTYLKQTGFMGHHDRTHYEPDYRKRLAAQIRTARRGGSERIVSAGSMAATKGAASTISRNAARAADARRKAGYSNYQRKRRGRHL